MIIDLLCMKINNDRSLRAKDPLFKVLFVLDVKDIPGRHRGRNASAQDVGTPSGMSHSGKYSQHFGKEIMVFYIF